MANPGCEGAFGEALPAGAKPGITGGGRLTSFGRCGAEKGTAEEAFGEAPDAFPDAPALCAKTSSAFSCEKQIGHVTRDFLIDRMLTSWAIYHRSLLFRNSATTDAS